MAVWPQVIARLVDLLPTLPEHGGVVVFDGPPVTADVPAEYVTVGFVPGEDFGGSFEQSPHAGRYEDIEVGTVRCQYVVQSGDVNLPAVRARAFALTGALQTYLKAHRDLETFPQDFTASLAVDVEPVQNAAGVAQRLIVTVSYEACA